MATKEEIKQLETDFARKRYPMRLDVFITLHKCKNCSRLADATHRLCPVCNELTRRSRQKWAEKNPELAKQSARNSRDRKQKVLKNAIFEKYNNSCNSLRCRWLNEDGTLGCKDKRALQIDHVNGGGLQEYKKLHQFKFLKKVLADSEGLYQLLCANCNWIKRAERKEVPRGRAHPSWQNS